MGLFFSFSKIFKLKINHYNYITILTIILSVGYKTNIAKLISFVCNLTLKPLVGFFCIFCNTLNF